MRKADLSTVSVDDLVRRFAEVTREQDKALLEGQMVLVAAFALSANTPASARGGAAARTLTPSSR